MNERPVGFGVLFWLFS